MAKNNEIECLENIKLLFSSASTICYADRPLIKKILNTSIPSKDDNKFPDFIFDGGILEHFIVTGSKDYKKGCEYKIVENKSQKETAEYFRKTDKEFLDVPFKSGTLSTASTENIFKESSYENFVISFKKHFEDHLASLEKSGSSNDIVVFVIEQQDGRMRIFDNGRFSKFYLLTEDKKILSYLANKSPSVNYIIFNCADSLEIIDISKINDLIKNAKENLDIRGGSLTNISLKVYLNI